MELIETPWIKNKRYSWSELSQDFVNYSTDVAPCCYLVNSFRSPLCNSLTA